MKTRLVVCLFLLAIPALPAHAQTAPAAPSSAPSAANQTGGTAAPAVDTAKATAIRHLLELNGTKTVTQELMNTMLPQMATLLHNSFKGTCGDDPKCLQLGDLVSIRMQDKMANSVDQLIDRIVPVYDRHFSKEDIDGLIQFYESPLGSKVAQNMPAISRESEGAGAQIGQDIAKESIQEVLQEHPELRSLASQHQ
ncbi:MAG TPA: DUF2059 domain-containing protein [Candidatus Acidoferrum sp.]|jgi:hypothetical protein|nr:DUF2059 domain-containing protein [Candidatus Acidoferrum sp.]